MRAKVDRSPGPPKRADLGASCRQCCSLDFGVQCRGLAEWMCVIIVHIRDVLLFLEFHPSSQCSSFIVARSSRYHPQTIIITLFPYWKSITSR